MFQIEDFVEGSMKKYLVGLLIVLGIGVGIFVFTPSPPDSVVLLDNTSGDVIATVAAVACGICCCPGFLCIFIKKLRFPMLIIVSFILLLFLTATCLDHAFKNLNYVFSSDKTPVERPCVITYHKHNQSTHIREDRRTGKDVFGHNKEYVTEHEETTDLYEVKFRFLDDGENGTEHVISRDAPFEFYNRVFEGDTCIAYVLTGAFGLDYVNDMRVKKRGR